MALRRRISAVRGVQAIYMPCVPRLLAAHEARLRAATEAAASTESRAEANGGGSLQARARGECRELYLPKNQPLFLPSGLHQDDLDGCICDLANIEVRLRNGQLHDALNKVRIYLYISRAAFWHSRPATSVTKAPTRAQCCRSMLMKGRSSCTPKSITPRELENCICRGLGCESASFMHSLDAYEYIFNMSSIRS